MERQRIFIKHNSRYEEALEYHNKAIELNPENPEYWRCKGNCLKELHRYEEAIICFDKSIELEPHGISLIGKIRSLEKLGRNEEATKFSKKWFRQ